MASFTDYFPIPEKLLPSGLRAEKPRFVTPEGRPVVGVLAQYETTPKVYHAAEEVRDAGYSKWDVHAPFPIHGIDEAMGQKRTILPLMVGMAAIAGAGIGYLMQWWISGNYEIVVQGKPYNDAWEPFVPITFEIAVLISAFTALFGMFALNLLPRFNHPLFTSDRFLRCSDDGFFIFIEADDESFDPGRTRELLEATGAHYIELVAEPKPVDVLGSGAGSGAGATPGAGAKA